MQFAYKYFDCMIDSSTSKIKNLNIKSSDIYQYINYKKLKYMYLAIQGTSYSIPFLINF